MSHFEFDMYRNSHNNFRKAIPIPYGTGSCEKKWARPAFIVFALFFCTSVTSADELDSLLKRLNLDGLRTVHIEEQLKSTVDIDHSKRLRQALATLYVKQLDSTVEKPEEFQKIANRLTELESSVPDLTAPETLFARLETQYRHAEFLLSRYRKNRLRVGDQTEANKLFQQTAERLDGLGQACEDRISKLEVFDGGTDSLANLKADREIELLSDISFRSAYYAGWSHLNSGLAGDTGRDDPSFKLGLVAFCRFLDIDPGSKSTEWTVEFLELESQKSAMAFLGVALSYLSIGQFEDADSCFELLRKPNVSPTVRGQITFWQIQTLLELGLESDATLFAKSNLSSADGLSPIQKGRIALLLIRFDFGKKPEAGSKHELGLLGFQVLAKLQQFELTSKLIDEMKITLPRPDFYSDWITGQYRYQAAVNSGSSTDFQVAATRLKLAVQQSDGIPEIDVERCRNRLAWAYYKAGDFAKAATQFEMVFLRIARYDQTTAASAGWLLHDCFLKQNSKDPAHVEKALKALQDLVARFPDASLTQKARLQIVKLRQNSMAAGEAVGRLESVVKNSPSDVLANYELNLARYRAYLQSRRKPDAVAQRETIEQLEQSLGNLRKLDEQLSDEQRLKTLLIQLDLNLSEKRGDVADLLAKADGLENSVTNRNLIAELHYRHFQVAKAKGDKVKTDRETNWLYKNGDGTVYQKSILVFRANQIEKQLKTSSEKGSVRAEAIEVYEKLVRTTGKDVASLKASNNARVSASRLAELFTENGGHENAAPLLANLATAFPSNANYLRRYARSLTLRRQYSSALEQWRKLSIGLGKETSGWYEAKYHVVLCLEKTAANDARKTLEQFDALYPAPPEPWKSKFNDLRNRLKK